MTRDEFNSEIRRLTDQWQNSYGEERKKVLFQAFQKTDISIFRSAISSCIASYRQAPLVEELEVAIQGAQRDFFDTARTKDTIPLLEKAAEKSTNKEFVAACLKALTDKASGKLTPQQFNEACDLLDETANRLCAECSTCGGSGYTKQGELRYLYRCFCAVGRKRPEIMYGPTRPDGTREQAYIAIWQRPLSPL